MSPDRQPGLRSRRDAEASLSRTRLPGRVRHGPWTEQAIRQELSAFLADRTVWPTCREFEAAGLKAMREAMMRIHGAEWWAREMGLPAGDRPTGGVRRWTDDRIRQTLGEFIGSRSTWPTAREFDEAGLHALREALRHYGGPARWSRELGVEWTPRRPRTAITRPAPKPPPRKEASWPRWTEQTITAALSEFLAGRSEWPRFDEFVTSGRKGLYQAVLKHGGTRRWADRMAVKWVDRRRTRPAWSEEQVREQLAAFLRGRHRWPTNAEFAEAGRDQLLDAIRRNGGSRRWAAECGLPFSGRANLWSDEAIEAAIEPLVRSLGRWPTKSEFRRAGLQRAMAAVYEHGGSRRWQEHFGVERSNWSGPVPDRGRWSPELVEAELRAVCQDREAWPSLAEFERTGPRGLYSAMQRHGGVRYWRQRMRLD